MSKPINKPHVCVSIIIDVEASGFGSLSHPIDVGVINQSGERVLQLVQAKK